MVPEEYKKFPKKFKYWNKSVQREHTVPTFVDNCSFLKRPSLFVNEIKCRGSKHYLLNPAHYC